MPHRLRLYKQILQLFILGLLCYILKPSSYRDRTNPFSGVRPFFVPYHLYRVLAHNTLNRMNNCILGNQPIHKQRILILEIAT